MPDVVVMTDTNSGMTKEEAKKYGVEVLPMSFIINGKIYYEGIDISHEAFFEKMAAGAEVSTSQPSPGEVTERWDKLLKRHDEVIYIPMSGGLSKSCETAAMLAEDYKGRVQVLDSKRVSAPQKVLVMDAVLLAGEGKSAVQIKETLSEIARKSVVYIAVDTLQYLKKGGRITGAAAAIGTVLHLKPVLEMRDKKLDAYAKARGMKSARRLMLQAIHEEIEEKYAEDYRQGNLCMQVAYTELDKDIIESWKKQIQEEFPELKLYGDPLPLCTACHIGPGALGVAVTKHINKNW